MIGQLHGILLEKNPPYLLLDVGGVGYEIEASTNTFYQLPEVGAHFRLHTHFVVREDAQLLYGFSDPQEKNLFRSLIKVNNVGPKLAIAILSGISPSHFVRCVIENDTASLVRIPGVGKKTAERLIIEMRDRLSDWDLQQNTFEKRLETSLQPVSTTRSDAVQALVALGYKVQEADRLIQKIKGDDLSSQDLIRLALKQTSV